jgi:hypothetical protein
MSFRVIRAACVHCLEGIITQVFQAEKVTRFRSIRRDIKGAQFDPTSKALQSPSGHSRPLHGDIKAIHDWQALFLQKHVKHYLKCFSFFA